MTLYELSCKRIAEMVASNEVKAPDFVEKAFQTSMVELKAPVVAEPAIQAFPTLREHGSSSFKRAFEFAKFLVPHSFGEGSSGEGSSYKKAKK